MYTRKNCSELYARFLLILYILYIYLDNKQMMQEIYC